MISIYILKAEKLTKNNFYDAVDSLPFGELEKTRLLSIKNTARRWESLGGLVALEKLVKKIGISPKPILRSSYGKPYFDGKDAISFGISHSCGVSAAAVDDICSDNIGFDIEVLRDNFDCESIADRFFTNNELKALENNGNTLESFFSIWTSKEAYAKKYGEGLIAGISRDIFNEQDNVYFSTQHVNVDGQKIIMSVCSDIKDQPIQIFIDCEE